MMRACTRHNLVERPAPPPALIPVKGMRAGPFWVGDCCRDSVPVVSHISKCTVVVVSLNRILMDEQSADTSAEIHLKMFR